MNAETKQCRECKEIVNIKFFPKKGKKCKKCVSLYFKQYTKQHKKEISVYQKTYREQHKENRLIYIEINKDKLSSQHKKYYLENRSRKIAYDKQYYINNKEKILIRKNKYHKENKKKVLNKHKQYIKTRRKIDLAFKLRRDLSSAIGISLKRNLGSKQQLSSFKSLGYTPKDLMLHLMNHPEKKEWMTQYNRGVYYPNTWDDNDQSTWKWHIDHIIPHSEFKYTSMKDEEFKKCWSLENLRPLSAKQNTLDGASKIRHQKVQK